MKKMILALIALIYGTFLLAQTEFDAQKLIQPDIIGTARYMGMAGAFGALGGDASAIKDNPGGLAIYRSSEITGTMNLMYQSSSSDWNGTSANDNLLNLGFNNFSYILAKPTYRSETGNTGLLSSNWSFSYNRLKCFDRNSTINTKNSASSITDYMSYFTGNIKGGDLSSSDYRYDPYNNGDVPWISVIGSNSHVIDETVSPISPGSKDSISSWSSSLLTGQLVSPSFSVQERGSIDEYSIGWAGNYSNKLFIGINANFQSINYSMNSQYKEYFGNNRGMTLSSSLATTGVGFNLNMGLIYRPVDMFRLGFAVHSPTVYDLSDTNSANMDYYIDYTTKSTSTTSTLSGNFDTPSFTKTYLMATPWKINASAAFILGKKGLISAEYVRDLSTSTNYIDKLDNQDYSKTKFDSENAGMKSVLKDVQTIKIGLEYKYTPNLAIRLGYANMSAGTNPLADLLLQPNTTRTDVHYFINNQTNFISAGIGYRESNCYMDLAYVNKTVNETFYAYNSFAGDLLTIMQNRFPTETNSDNLKVKPANVNTMSNNLVFTIGLKF